MNKIKDLYSQHKVLIYSLLGIIGVFLLWYLISLLANTTLFPGPEKVIPEFFSYLGQNRTYVAIGGTLFRLLIAILLSIVAGLIFGILAGLHENFYLFFKPFVVVLKTIPTAAIIFIIIALLKPKYAPIIVVFLITFPLVYESVVAGFKNIDPNLINALRIDGAKTFRSIFEFYLPLSSNYIALGIASSIGLGMKVSIMSEILAGSDSADGLGKLIRDASTTVDMTSILAYSLIAIIIIGIVDIAIYFAKRGLKKKEKKA